MNILKIAEVLESYSEDVLAYKLDGRFANAVTEAVSLLISQGEQIADLQNELRDERYRHDRVQDFEVAEAEELRLAKEQLRRHGCDYCKHEDLGADEFPCCECSYAGGRHSRWDWAKPEPPKEVQHDE